MALTPVYYLEGASGTNAGTTTNPYNNWADFYTNLDNTKQGYAAGTETMTGARADVNKEINVKQWPGKPAWVVDADGQTNVFDLRATCDIRDVEVFGSAASGIVVRECTSGETINLQSVIARDCGGNGVINYQQDGGTVTISGQFYDNTTYGIFDDTQSGGTFVAESCDCSGNGGGQEIYLNGCTGGTQKVTRCKIHDGAGYGIKVSGCTSGDIEVSWNATYDLGTSGGAAGLEMGGGACTFVGNTVYDVQYGIVLIATATNSVVKNNIVNAPDTGAIFVMDGAQVGFDSDNNCFEAGISGLGYWRTGWAADLAAWRTNSSQDANSTDQDPLFLDATNDNFALASSSSPCYEAGTTVTGVTDTTDHEGNTVGATPHIGAFQIVAAASGNTWYVDSVNGSDSNSGLSAEGAWATLGKYDTEYTATIVASGDTLVLVDDSTFREQLTVQTGLTYGRSSGGTNKPIVSGADIFDGYAFSGPDGNGEYTIAATTEPKIVIVDGTVWTEGTAGSLGATEWDWAADVLYLGADPAGLVVEAGQRNYPVFINSKTGIGVRGVRASGANSYGFYLNAANGDLCDIESISVRGGLYCNAPAAGTTNITATLDNRLVSGSFPAYLASQTQGTLNLDVTIGDGACGNSDQSVYVAPMSGGTVNLSGTVSHFASDGTTEQAKYVYVTGQSGGTVNIDGLDVSGSSSQEIYLNGCTGGTQKITRCKIHDGTGHGVSANGCTSGGIEISWCAIWNMGNATDDYSVLLTGSAGSTVVANTIYGGMYGLGLSSSANCTLNNNAVASIGGRPLFSSSSDTGALLSHNCYYDHNYSFRWEGANYITLALYQTASSQDANSIDSDPSFRDTSNNDFRLYAASPCINAGTTVSGITGLADMNGDGTAPGTNPEIGAFNAPLGNTIVGDYTNNGPLTNTMRLGVEIRKQEATDTVYRYKNWCAAAHGWREYNDGTWTLSGSDTALNAAGCPSSVPEGTVTRAMVQAVWDSDGYSGCAASFPAGDYVFTYDGTAGSIEVKGSPVTVTSTAAGRIEFTSDGSEDVYIEISGAVSNLANFVICEDQYEGDWEDGDYWYPQTLVELEGVQCLQFEAWNICAGWSQANTPYPTWAQRRPVDWFGYHMNPYTGHGSLFTAGTDYRAMPYELQVDLCNQVGCDYWLTIPHWVDQTFTESLAAFVHANLHHDATVYIEYAVEPFFDGSAGSPANYSSEFLYDLGVSESDTNPQADRYCIRAEERFGWFKGQCGTRTVKAAITSAPKDTWSGYSDDWIANLVANVNSGVVTPDLWASSVYPGSPITPASGGMGMSWANWLTAAASDVETYMAYDCINKIASVDDLLADIASTGLPLGIYEWGMSGKVTDYWGGNEADADTIGDLIRAAYKADGEYDRTLYVLNALADRCNELVIYYCASTHRRNDSAWGLADSLVGINAYAPTGSAYDDQPRYYAAKRYMRKVADSWRRMHRRVKSVQFRNGFSDNVQAKFVDREGTVVLVMEPADAHEVKTFNFREPFNFPKGFQFSAAATGVTDGEATIT